MISNDMKKRINNFFGNHPIRNEEIQRVEKNLDVALPQDFIDLNKISSYECSNLVGFFNFGDEGPDSVIAATLGLRESYSDCTKYLALYLDDAGIILMNIEDMNASVIWCSIYDLDNLFNQKEMCYKYRLFNSFADFFAYLLDEEEKKRTEKKSL